MGFYFISIDCDKYFALKIIALTKKALQINIIF